MIFSKAPRLFPTATARLTQTTAHLKPRTHSRMAHNSTATLNTGAKIPLLGFGTWQDKEAQEPAVTVALRSGYRHIDTARIYGTEAAVVSIRNPCNSELHRLTCAPHLRATQSKNRAFLATRYSLQPSYGITSMIPGMSKLLLMPRSTTFKPITSTYI